MFPHLGYETAADQCLVNNVDNIARKNGPEHSPKHNSKSR
jgi:hypothetical protein